MTKQLTGRINVYTCCKTKRGVAVPPGVKGDILCDSGVLYPCAEGLSVIPCQPWKHLVLRRGILRFFRQPFPGIHIQWQEQLDSGFVLDYLNLPVGNGFHNVFPTEIYDVIDTESAETGEKKCPFDVLAVAGGDDKPFYLLYCKILALVFLDGQRGLGYSLERAFGYHAFTYSMVQRGSDIA